MPRRSNEFQKLVYLVKRHVSASASVTESKMLIDRATLAEREVDVCIEDRIADHDITISIECRDRGRKADVGWVEEMKAKHERLPTSGLVLVSRNGFSAEASRVAQVNGIETLALEKVDEDSIARLLGDAVSLLFGAWSFTPRAVAVRVPARARAVRPRASLLGPRSFPRSRCTSGSIGGR